MHGTNLSFILHDCTPVISVTHCCHSGAVGAVSLGGDCRRFEAMLYSYCHGWSKGSGIFHSIPNLIRNVDKHSGNYAVEASWITFAVIHFFAPCVMHLSVHWTAMCTVRFDRQVDSSAMNWNGFGRKSSWISRRKIKHCGWVIWGRALKLAASVTRVPA